MYLCKFVGRDRWEPENPGFDHQNLVFTFAATPEEAVGSPTESERTVTFRARLVVGGSVVHCGNWRDLSEEDRRKHFLCYLREQIEKRGISEFVDRDVEKWSERLDEYTDNGRFAEGTKYNIENFDLNEPFEVDKPEGKIGGFSE